MLEIKFLYISAFIFVRVKEIARKNSKRLKYEQKTGLWDDQRNPRGSEILPLHKLQSLQCISMAQQHRTADSFRQHSDQETSNELTAIRFDLAHSCM